MDKGEITKENYYSDEMRKKYLGVTQYKQLTRECQAKKVAELNGEYSEPTPQAFLIGSYVHAWCESEEAMQEFANSHPEIYCKADKDKPVEERRLLKDFRHAKTMIERLESFDVVDYYLTGDKEVIIEFELGGHKWKSAIDVLNLDRGYFVDLKTSADLNDKVWNNDYTQKVSFIEKYDYILQMAVYQYGLHQVFGKWLTPYIVVVDKTDVPDVAVIKIDEPDLFKEKIKHIEQHVDYVAGVKNGDIEPTRCEKCDYCKSTKELTGVIDYKDFIK